MSDIDPKDISQKWVHSHEEDTPTETVFRPASYRFPPSRGRKSFELRSDGSMQNQGIGPDDRPVSQGGKWLLKKGKTPQLELDLPGGRSTTLEIVAADKDRLVVKK
jgi:hypothetical protein